MRVGIIDDEIHCIESLVLGLRNADPSIEVAFKASRVDDALEVLQKVTIDILFLDVEMPCLNGFELLEQLGHIPFDVVFTTAYSQYAVKAFKYKAFDYLIKPVDEKDLQMVLEKFESREAGSSRLANQEIAQFMKLLKKDNIISSKIAVPVSDGLEFIKVEDIMYAQSQNNYTLLFLSDGDTLLFSKTLKKVECTLSKYFFLRIHQSYLINPNYMKKYFRNDGGGVMMENGVMLPISHSKKEEIVSLFEAIAKNKSL